MFVDKHKLSNAYMVFQNINCIRPAANIEDLNIEFIILLV